MASRFYGINKGAALVTEDSSTTSKGVEVVVDLSKGFLKSEVHIKLQELRNFIFKGPWPAMTTLEGIRRWGLDRGQHENQVGTAVQAYATLVNQGLTYLARSAGVGGNSITIALVDPAGNNQALAISVVGSAISVSLATGSGGAITTTRTLLQAALLANAAVQALVSVTGSGATAITALSATPLASGALPVVSNDDIYVDVRFSAGLKPVDFENAIIRIRDWVDTHHWPPA